MDSSEIFVNEAAVEETDLRFRKKSGGTTDDVEGEAAGIEEESLPRWSRWVLLPRSYYYRQFVRSVSLVNLFILVLSLPWKSDKELNFVQFICITVADFLLACLYTVNFTIRICYRWHLRKKTDSSFSRELEQKSSSSSLYTNWFRVLISFGLMLIMWYSVAIGVYKSILITIPWQWYLGYVIRCVLPVPPVIAMFSREESSFFQRLSRLLKWRQLAMVTMFYFIFVSVLALMGVHLIGGLNHACVYRTLEDDGTYSIILAHPFTHCNPTGTPKFCQLDDGENLTTGLVCAQFPPRDNGSLLFFDYRSYVYYGQFTVILDALYAVYEASTLELWSFMMYSAIEGRGMFFPILIYLVLTLFIVIILQQSIFLVVIIESFADLRSKSFFREANSSVKVPNKPTTVLSIKDGSVTFTSMEVKSSVLFIEKYSNKLLNFEKVFLVLVIVDAILTASKHTGMEEWFKLLLQYWQLFASIAFVMEILAVFFFHIYHGQWKLFFCRPYYLCLIVLACGGVIGAIPLDGFYNPLKPGNGLAIFQSFRFPRLLRFYKPIQDFAVKIMGKNIPILSLITICIIVWLSVINAHIFGYMEVSEECDSDSNTFGSLKDAFVATFQIVMNEAWTDVTSEVMCRSKYWFVTNFYFIVIHLFSSLIFLNFFGAVILDNLEYDEEKKKAILKKLNESEKKFAESVPAHLTIYEKLNGKPKKLKTPPGIGKWDPKLGEMEIRRFFEAPNVTELVEDPVHVDRGSMTKSMNYSFSVDDDGATDDVPLRQTRDINAMLDYIKLWKQCNEEESTKRTHISPHVHYLLGQASLDRSESLPSNSIVPSSYDIFRERYEYFDKALFCMSREHKLRRLCTLILTAQTKPPRNAPSDEKKGLLYLCKKRFSYTVRWIISRMPYSTWILFFGLGIIISVQMENFSSSQSPPRHSYNTLCEILYLLLMFSWLMLKVISRGCFLNPHAAISSPWDVIDWILVLDSAILFALIPLWGEFAWDEIDLAIAYLPPLFRAMFVIRCLRPLHIISMYYSTRAIVGEIVKGWKNLVKANVIMFGFIFMFASLGVQLFSGTDPNPIAFCNDPRVTNRQDCVGQFEMKLETSREFLSLNASLIPSVAMLVPRVWYSDIRDFSFNHVGLAFVTLFELLTLEGWPEVRELFDGRNSKANAIYMHVFVFFAVNIGLQLFVGIIVNNFNEQKPGHTSLLTVDQNRWVELMQRISLQRPYKRPEEPRHNIHRRRLYSVVTSSYFRFVPTVITAVLALTLVVPWNENLIDQKAIDTLIVFSILLNNYSTIEMALKLFAFGPAYFRSWRNNFDFALTFISFLYSLIAMVSVIRPELITHVNVSYFALVLVLAKLLTVLVKYSSMLNLLWTVISTMISSASLFLVLLIVILCYGLVGVALFSNIRTGEAINYYLVHFKGISYALNALWRTLTGEDWYQFMWDAAVEEPYCQESLKNCGNGALSVLYFTSFTFLMPFILLNVFIGVLLEKFSIFYNDEETSLDHDIIKDFKNNWRHFDSNANGNIPISRAKLLLRSLKLESYHTYTVGEIGKRVRKSYQLHHPLLLWEMEKELKVTSNGLQVPPSTNTQHSSEMKVKFGSVLRMLAYRCEDINKRLEPQELFTRKELEQNLQLDVAQQCIFKWMKRRVQPVIRKRKESERLSALEQSQKTGDRPTAIERRQRFRSIMRSQYLLCPVGEQDTTSMNSEDEEGTTKNPASQLGRDVSEDQIDCSYDGQQNRQFLCTGNRSFMKLNIENNSLKTHDDKVKQWYEIQEKWMENVETDDNYFDDLL